MTPSVTHKKGFSLGVSMAIFAVLFVVLTPTSAFAADDWCAQFRDKGIFGLGGDKVPKIRCYSTPLICQQSVTAFAAEGSITAQCTDKTNPATATEPGQQRMITQVAEEKRQEARAAKSNGFITGPLYALLSPVLIPLAGLTYFIFKIAGLFLVSMAGIMDWSISVSIDSQLLGSAQFVDIGWTAVRNFANMFFIFALLYIAIQTILGLGGSGAKRMLVHIIIAALLINFSLFMTKVVIDSGNILGVTIWNKIKTQQGPATIPGASSKVLGGLDLQTVFENANVGNITNYAMNADVLIAVYAGGAVFMFIAGYVFLAGALMMITRTIMLLLLMVFSPFAFMALGLPKLEQYGHKWMDKLIKQTFVAPFFIFMLYLNAVIVDKMDIFNISGSKGQSFANALVGNGDYQIIFNFILMIGFLVASLTISNSFAGDVGSHARGWAKSASKWAGGMAGGAAVGTGAFAMRQGLGKIGMMGKDNATLHEMAAQKGLRGMVGRGAIALSTGMTKATYDPRATKLGARALSGDGRINIGEAGGRGGYTATGSALSKVSLGSWGYTGTAADKEVLARAEERYANDPKGKEAYLRANLGTIAKTRIDEETGKPVVTERFASRYDGSYEHKGLREKVGREVAIKEYKESLRKSAGEYAGLEKAGQIGKDEIIDGKATGKKIGDAAAEAIKVAVGKLGGKEFVETMTTEQLSLAPVIEAMNSQHLSALTQMKGTELDPETINAISSKIVQNGTESGRNYLKSQAKIGGVFQYDGEKELERLTRDYDADKDGVRSSPQKLKNFQAEVGRTLGMVGGAKEIAELKDELIAHEALVSQYNTKVVREFEKRIKDGDISGNFATKLSQSLRTHGRGATGTNKQPPETPLPTIDLSLPNK